MVACCKILEANSNKKNESIYYLAVFRNDRGYVELITKMKLNQFNVCLLAMLFGTFNFNFTRSHNMYYVVEMIESE